jgi:hypothetical protein
MGGSRRRNVPDQMEQPMMRNEHIVRGHQTPIVACNPDNGNQPWRVVHVNNAAAAGGNGTAEAPFTTLAQGDTAATNPWDIVFVNRGTGTAVGYDTRFYFKAPNQFLIGNGQPFLINTATCGLQNIATSTNGRRPLLSNPSGASVAIDGSVAPGAVVSTFDITGSAIGIYATGNLSSGIPRSGPATPTSYRSSTGDTVITDVTINGSGAGQTGVLLDGGTGGAGGETTITPTSLAGGIRFFDTAITDTDRFGMRVSGPSDTSFRADYNGSITTSAAENVLLVNDLTGGTVNVAEGTAPAGSTVPNAVTATGGGGIRLLGNSDQTTINVGNVSLSKTAGNAIAVEEDNATTLIRAGNGTGINRAADGAAIYIDGLLAGGSPKFTYEGPITNARATGSTNPSYLLSAQEVGAGGDIKLISPAGNPFADTGDGIFVSQLGAGANVLVSGATITSSGGTGILVQDSAGFVDFRQIGITGASTAGVALLQSQSGFDANFRGLSINLAGANATGFLAATNTSATYVIDVQGSANTITTTSATQPAVSIEAGTANGSPVLGMLFSTVAAGVPSGGNNALVFGAGATGTFSVSSSFTVAGGTPGTVAGDVTPGGVTVLVPAP